MIETTRSRLTLLVAVVLALLAGMSVVAAASTEPRAQVAHGPAALARLAHQHIDWTGCQTGPDDDLGKELDKAGAQCAEVTVPLDYANPGGRTITVAMSRLAATDTAHRIGTLFLNSGGPGGLGLDMPPQWKTYLGDVGSRYDLIGMDPRFVGRSSPLDCHWPTGSMTRAPGDSRAEFDGTVAFEAALAKACTRSHGDLLPFATTRNTARDMDLIRRMLGEERISYLGYSYGTYLGAVYTQLFPGRTDRVLLDSALSPDRFGPAMFADMIAPNTQAFRAWARWTAARDTKYHLGRTERDVIATVHGVIDSAARKPLQVGRYAVDDHLIPFVLFNNLSDDRDEPRASLADSVRVLAKAAASRRPVRPTADLADVLQSMLTGTESATGSVQSAILCGDRAAPTNPAYYWRKIQDSRAADPVFGPMLNDITPCAFWPKPVEQPTRVHNAVPALIVNSTGDDRTPYQGAQKLHRLMTGSRFLTLRGATIHAVFGNYGNSCVDGIVNDYFRSGILPARDRICR